MKNKLFFLACVGCTSLLHGRWTAYEKHNIELCSAQEGPCTSCQEERYPHQSNGFKFNLIICLLTDLCGIRQSLEGLVVYPGEYEITLQAEEINTLNC